MHRLSIVFLVIFTVSVGLLSCGGEDGTDSSSTALNESSRIVGTVEELLMSSAPENNQTLLADIKDLLAIVVSANAQDGDLCGILVKVIQNGEEVATTETNCDGEFEVNEIAQGPTVLIFENDFFSDTLELNVPANGTVDLKVSLDDNEGTNVSINEINITTGPVVCEDGVLNVGNGDINELNIIGNGGSCVNIVGSCDVSILAQNINLKECNVCINASNGAFVSVTASEDFDCNADEVGINSTGDSDVVVSGDNCTIESGESQIVEDEGGVVDTENCEEVELEGPDEEGDDGEGDGGEGGDDGEEGDDDDDNNNNNDNPVCEYDCSSSNCELFCNDGIPADCKESCNNADNISLCIQECTGIECGRPICHEICIEEGAPVCEVDEKEVCEEVCEGECEEECVEFRKEEVLDGECFEGCLLSECGELEGEQREICFDELEGPCGSECTELVETDDCIEFEVVGCECDEVCEVVEVEECFEVCEEEGISCRFECEEINI